MSGEEDELVGENCSPYYGCKLEGRLMWAMVLKLRGLRLQSICPLAQWEQCLLGVLAFSLHVLLDEAW